MTAVSWLDWKLGARMLLRHPALTIIGGLSLAAAIAIGVVGMEVADELLYKRLPFDEGGRVVRLETQDVAASRVEPRVLHDFAIWRRSLEDGDGTRRRARERAQRAHGRRPRRNPARGGDHGVGVSAHPRAAAARQAAAASRRKAGCGARRGPGLRRLAETVPARPRDHRPRRDGGPHGSHRGGRDAAALRLPAQSAGMGAIAGPGRAAAGRAGRGGVRPPRRRSELAGRRGGARGRLGTRCRRPAGDPRAAAHARSRIRRAHAG